MILVAAGDGDRNWSFGRLPGVESKPDSGWWGLERSRAPGRRLRKVTAGRGYAEVVELGRRSGGMARVGPGEAAVD